MENLSEENVAKDGKIDHVVVDLDPLHNSNNRSSSQHTSYLKSNKTQFTEKYMPTVETFRRSSLSIETDALSAIMNDNNNNDEENGRQSRQQKGNRVKDKWQSSVRSRNPGPQLERVIDQLRESTLNYQKSDWDTERWRHLEDRRHAMGHVFENKNPNPTYNADRYEDVDSLPSSSSRTLHSVSHQSGSTQRPGGKLPPIENDHGAAHGMNLSDNMLKSMLKYRMNVGKLLQKAAHGGGPITDSSTGYQDMATSQSSIDSLPMGKEASASLHKCYQGARPTPHVDEFGPPPPRQEYSWASKHSMHKRWPHSKQDEALLPKYSRFALESGGSLPQLPPNQTAAPYQNPQLLMESKPALPRSLTRDRGVQVTLLLGSPLRLASCRTFSEMDESSTPSIITQIYTVDAKKKPTEKMLGVKKPSLWSARTASSSIVNSVQKQKTNSIMSMRPTNSVAHYIYSLKNKEADRRSLVNVMNNFFEIGSEKSSSRLMKTVIGEVSDTSSQSSTEEEYRVVRQNVKKNPRASLNCLRLKFFDLKLWWKRLQRRQEDNPIFLEQIKTIEGHFGSGIVSFFVFLRWIISLNALFACIWLLFIVFPQIGAFTMTNNGTFYALDIFTGEGALEDSWLFYGTYTEMVGVYPLALLYLVAIIATFFGGFFIVLRSLACAIEDEGVNLKGTPYTFLTLVFSSWDYSLTVPEAATNLSLGIANTFREVIREMEVRKVLESQSKKEKFDLYARRCLAWIITIILVTLGVTVIFLVVSSDLKALLTKWGYKVTSESFVILYGPVIVFILINVTIPEFIYPLPILERYSRGKEEIHITIARVFVLRIFNVLALVVSLRQKVKQTSYEGCAGTLIAQELYKLVLIDTVVSIFTVMVPHYVKFYWYGEKQEFDMPPQVLKIIYRQAVVWLGTLVSPLMPLIGVLSGMIFFVSTYVMVMRTCKPPEKRWNQPRRSTFFMMLTAVTLLVLIILVSIVIGRSDFVLLGEMGQDKSRHCGPFKNQTMTTVFLSWQKEMLVNYPSFGESVGIVLSGTVLMPTIFVMLALLYFQKLRIGWEKKHSSLLFTDLEQERSTNIELLKKIHQNVPFG